MGVPPAASSSLLIGKATITENSLGNTKTVKQDARLSTGQRVTLIVTLDKNADIQSNMEKISQKVNSQAKAALARWKEQPARGTEFRLDLRISQPPGWVEIKSASYILHPHSQKQTESHFDPTKMEHLFLKETPKYFKRFIEKLAIRYPEKRQELDTLRKDGITRLQERYKENYQAWKHGSLSPEEALQQWGSKEERKRQNETSDDLNHTIYSALALVEPDEKKAESLRNAVTKEMAEDRRAEITESETGRIGLSSQFTVETDTGASLAVTSKTSQFRDDNLTSLDIRDGSSKGLVNAMVVRDTFTCNGTQAETLRMRSGSGDYDKVEPKSALILTETEYQEIVEPFQMMNAEGKEQYIHNRLINRDFKACQALGEYLEKTTDPKRGKELQKYAQEFYKDQAIVDFNASVVGSMLRDPTRNTLGHQMPSVVKDAFKESGEPELDPNNKGWGIINLQTPVNITGGRGFNKQLLNLSKNTKFPGSIRKILGNLTSQDVSELRNIHRDMQGYQKARDQEKIPCKYFNFPTNFIGKERSIITIRGKPISLRLKTLFTVGSVDKQRSKDIEQETNESLRYVYETTDKALTALKAKKGALEAEKGKATPGEAQKIEAQIEELNTYASSLQCLKEQTFEKPTVDAEGNLKAVRLMRAPNASAQFESIGRLTILMERLNMVTKGNCRSGNNRTANWEAKTKQLEGCLVASGPAGNIPSPEITATKFKRPAGKEVQKPHWSLGVYAGAMTESTTLQSANKGTRGTKEQVSEYGKLKGAVLKGAFDLAQRFDSKLFKTAKNPPR
jgi:hypothetical protein